MDDLDKRIESLEQRIADLESRQQQISSEKLQKFIRECLAELLNQRHNAWLRSVGGYKQKPVSKEPGDREHDNSKK